MRELHRVLNKSEYALIMPQTFKMERFEKNNTNCMQVHNQKVFRARGGGGACGTKAHG